MDDIIEILLDLIGEVSNSLINNKNIPKWIRYTLMFIISLIVISIIVGLLILGIIIIKTSLLGGILILGVDLILSIMVIGSVLKKKKI